MLLNSLLVRPLSSYSQQQQLFRYLGPSLLSAVSVSRSVDGAERHHQRQNNICSTTRNLCSSSPVVMSSSSRFALADKYKGLEKNVWYCCQHFNLYILQ